MRLYGQIAYDAEGGATGGGNAPAPGTTIATSVTQPAPDPAADAAALAATEAAKQAAKQAALDADPAAKAAADAAALAQTEADKAAAKLLEVPEEYEFTMPEGMQIDPAAVEMFTPIAKDLKLTNEQAQKIVSLQAQLTQDSAKRWTDQVAAWGAEAKADKDFGGQNYTKNVSAVAKFLDKFASTDARKALDDSGMGNHPALLKAFAAAGLAMGNDTFASGNSGGGGTPRTAAEVLFPASQGFKH